MTQPLTNGSPYQASTSSDGLVNGDRAALGESVAHVGVTIMSESGHAGRAQRPLPAPPQEQQRRRRRTAKARLLLLCAASGYALWRTVTAHLPAPRDETQHINDHVRAASAVALV